MIALIVIAVIATDLAVAALFLVVRRQLSRPSTAMLDAALSTEMEDLVMELRNQAEQAAAELSRQKAQLRRMASDLEHRQPAAVLPAAPPHPAEPRVVPITRRDIVGFAAEGLSFRTIAARTGLSVEEVRLMLAMEDETVAA